MRPLTWGPVVKQRVRGFLEALLSRVDEFDFQWQDEYSTRPKLVVRTKLRFLEKLTYLKSGKMTQFKSGEIREVIKRLEELEILEDRRFNKQGAEEWYFALKLWSKEPAKNLSQFDREWENKRPEKSITQVPTLEEATNKSALQNHSSPHITVSLGYGNYSRKIPPRLPLGLPN